jgi:ATP-dependent Clp protease ATP-binding subunit ClpB
MNPDRFTVKLQEALQAAQSLAQSRSHQRLEPEHFLLALIQQEDGLVPELLEKAGANRDRVRTALEGLLSRIPSVSGGSALHLSERAGKLLNKAEEESKKLTDEYISTEHVLLASFDDAALKEAYQRLGLRRESVEVALKSLRGAHRVTDQNPEGKYRALDKYARDLTELARKGKLDPVIGRDEEVRRVIQVLTRRTKNNPVLIGEPGVGKTAIAEGLAQRIIRGDVPENLRDKRVMALDLGALIAGTKFRGEFEDRLKAVLKEIEAADGQPAWARGELHCVGATTLDEYRKHIEKDPALERRFAPILVEEPSVEETVAILRGLKERYEVHHGVRITDSAIVAAAKLSSRYIADRFLPDKAIDLIDEAAARLRMEIDSMPVEIDRNRCRSQGAAQIA